MAARTLTRGLSRRGWDRAGFDDSAWQAVSVVDGPGGALTPEIAPPIRVMHVYAPVKVTHPKSGVTVYDLGQNFAGWPEIAVSWAGRGDGETDSGRTAGQGWSGVAAKLRAGRSGLATRCAEGGKGVETWHPRFSYYGFRYVQVEGAATGGGGADGEPARGGGS